MVLHRQIGQELQRAGRFGDHALQFASAGSHLQLKGLAAQHVGFAHLTSRNRQRFRGHNRVAGCRHLRQHSFIAIRLEIQVDAVAGDGGLRGIRGRHQARIVVAVDLLRQAVVVEIHGELVRGVK